MTPPIVLLSLISILPAVRLAAQPDRFGTPACSRPDHELADRTYFVLCYDGSRRVPAWVGYELKPQHLITTTSRPSHFRRDPGLTLPAAHDSDFRQSGFHRGHVAPARDFSWDRQAIRATFLLSNAVPQYPGANIRSAQLEAAIRRIAAECDAVFIFSGPIFDSPQPHTIGANRVAVPSHTYKVVLAIHDGTLSMYAAIIPNTAEPLDAFITTVDEVERRTALNFFDALEDDLEESLESRVQPFPGRS